jgi:hypothetical protein
MTPRGKGYSNDPFMNGCLVILIFAGLFALLVLGGSAVVTHAVINKGAPTHKVAPK